VTWWQRLRRRWRLERELDAELPYHLDRLTEDLVAGGVPPAEARRRARRAFGGIEEVKDTCRDVRGTRAAHDLAFDVHAALRLAARERTSSVLAVFALALGIGVSTMLFTIVDALCLRTFPLDRVERLVEIGLITPSGARQGVSPAAFRRLESARPEALSGVSAYAVRPAAVRDADSAAERVTVAYVSGTLFDTLHLRPGRGRGLAVADDASGAGAVVVIGDRVRRRLDSAGDDVLGRPLRLDGAVATVVGTMPEAFGFPDRADAWRPLSALHSPASDVPLTVIGRLAEGATADAARVAVASLLDDQASGAAGGTRPVVSPLDERYRNPVTNPAWLAFITTAVLLVLIAASNVATLLLSRGARRQREMAIRLALGGTRARIVRQLLVETALVIAAGGLGAAAVGMLGLRVFEAAIPDGGIPYWVSLRMDGTVFAVLAATCLGTVFLAGLAPALAIVRGGTGASLREEGRVLAPGATARRWTWVFLTSQLALTVILLAAVGLTTNDLLARERETGGTSPDRLLTFSVALPPETYPADAARDAFLARLQDSLIGSGRVDSMTLVDALPAAARGARRLVMQPDPSTSDPPVRATSIGSDFFRTLGLDLRAGREPSPDVAGIPEVVVNERFASLFLGGTPLGRTIRLAPLTGPGAVETRVVVGVAPDLQGGRSPADPAIFIPLTPAQRATAVVIAASSGNAAAVAPLVREQVRRIDPDVPVLRLQTLADAIWSARWNARVSQGLITTIALVALLLATLGLTALTMQWVAQSGHELGVRVALGARPVQIVWLVVRRVLLQVAVGLGVGSIGAWAWSRAFGPAGALTAPANLAAVAGVVLVVTLAAALWPARRAARVDPLTVIRGA
jgi:putative ABC transport system permease protein